MHDEPISDIQRLFTMLSITLTRRTKSTYTAQYIGTDIGVILYKDK